MKPASVDSTKRICLWSGPRNISTALMYSFAQRADTKVYDEPLYAHYLYRTNANEYHPGADDVMISLENDGEKVIDMMMGEHEKPIVFFKNMTHHILDLDKSFLKDTINVILTRDPVEMLPSFAEVIDNPTMTDVGYQLHIDLVSYLESIAVKPIIIDSKRILLDPEKALRELCEKAGIAFDSDMLSWKMGARPEDGVWAKYWYGSIHKSTGFMNYNPKSEPFPKHLKPLLEDCKVCYQKLVQLI